MTLREALSFRLPNGRMVGEASPAEWMETAQLYRREADFMRQLDPADVSTEGCARIQALLERDRDFSQALETINKELKERLRRRGKEQRTWLSVRSFGLAPPETGDDDH
jgi:hypothetical protein